MDELLSLDVFQAAQRGKLEKKQEVRRAFYFLPFSVPPLAEAKIQNYNRKRRKQSNIK